VTILHLQNPTVTKCSFFAHTYELGMTILHLQNPTVTKCSFFPHEYEV
jgi:uncharacterized protein (DUF2062 family)